MQNVHIIDDSSRVYQTNQPAWIKLWHKNWNYTHWLMTSMITTVICSEVYSILLSIYPEFLNIYWFNLGVTSATFASILSFSAVVGLGILSGWLFYSLQLFIFSLQLATKDYKPLIDLWKTYNHEHDAIIHQLFTDENFHHLSSFLKDQRLPSPIANFLGNQQNIEQVTNVLNMLKRIWQIEQVDSKLKALALNILSEVSKSEHTQEHINNISQLCNLLIDTNQFNQETVLKTLENSHLLHPYIPKLQQLSIHKDLIYKLIEEPKLMEYFLITQELFSGQHERVMHNIETLYLYLRHDLTHHESFISFKQSQDFHAKKAVVAPECFVWLQTFQQQPKSLMIIWDNLLHHPKLDWIEDAIIFMASHEEFNTFIHHAESVSKLTGLFNRLSILNHDGFRSVANLFNHYHDDLQKSVFCKYLMLLDQCDALNEEIILYVFNQPNLQLHQNLFQLYVEKIWKSGSNQETVIEDIKSIFMENSNIKQTIQQLALPEINVLAPHQVASGAHISEKPQTLQVSKKPSRGMLHWFAKRMSCTSSSTLGVDELPDNSNPSQAKATL